VDIDKMNRLARIGFEDFRAMALDESLNQYEKIGAHEAFRRGKEEAIFRDILSKLPALHGQGRKVIDIGAGCSDLPRLLIQWCADRNHRLVMLDSGEMLSLLPQAEHLEKIPARFPDCEPLIQSGAGSFDVVIVYSVIHYVFREANVWDFIDKALCLLAPGGMMLVGDIANASKRRRFFASEAGVKFHKAFMKTEEAPRVDFNRLEPGSIDDAVVLGLIARARAQGFDAYILPQAADLPMANRREDLLIARP
jgi:2-polyprenyl-3-methyl-5-hydroxy-6-metoxy-1,4-benzoquinol methylase